MGKRSAPSESRRAAPSDRADAGTTRPTLRRGRRPARFPLWWIVLLELAAGLGGLGYVLDGVPRIVSWVVAGVALVLIIVPVRGQWLVQRLGSQFTLRRRIRAQRREQGIAVVTGAYSVTSVQGRDELDVGIARTATSATVAVELRSDDLFNNEPSIGLADLQQLLEIEGVPFEAVRLISWSVPARVASDGSATGAGCRTVSRYLVLSVGVEAAKEELAVRGGGQPGLEQLMRRAVLRGREVIDSLGLTGLPVDGVTMSRLLEASLGPARLVGTSGAESWRGVTIGPTTSTSYSLTGSAESALSAAAEIIPLLPATLVVTTVAVTAGAAGYEARAVLRVSAVGAEAAPTVHDVRSGLDGVFAQHALPVVALDGEQVPALRWTLPIGVAA